MSFAWLAATVLAWLSIIAIIAALCRNAYTARRKYDHWGDPITDGGPLFKHPRSAAIWQTVGVLAVVNLITLISWPINAGTQMYDRITPGIAAHMLGLEEHQAYPLVIGNTVDGSSLEVTTTTRRYSSTTTTGGTPGSALIVDFGSAGVALELPTEVTHTEIIPDNEPETFALTFRNTALQRGVHYHYQFDRCQHNYRVIVITCHRAAKPVLSLSADVRNRGLPTLVSDYVTRVDLRLHASTRDKIYGFAATTSKPTTSPSK